MRTIHSLYRFPVKGLSPEPLKTVAVQAGQGFPRDRELAFTNGRWPYDAAQYTPRPKTDFLMLMQHESLAALRTQVSDDGARLRVQAPDGTVLDLSLDDAADLARAGAFFASYLGGRLEGSPQLVKAGSHRFTDVSVVSSTLMQSVSVINLASVRDLGARMGRELNPLRFRANVYYDGGEPWEELAWIDRELRLGDVPVRAVLRTRRCAATNVDPTTGARDLGIPQALIKNFRHGDMGVYVELLAGGTLRPGDTLHIPN
ncbi:MAG: MOSC domain-containing protein [Burkholderiaceae bacterium]